jgi:hypothetical protein
MYKKTVEVKVMLRPTASVSQSVRPSWCRAPSGLKTRFYLLLRQLRFCGEKERRRHEVVTATQHTKIVLYEELLRGIRIIAVDKTAPQLRSFSAQYGIPKNHTIFVHIQMFLSCNKQSALLRERTKCNNDDMLSLWNKHTQGNSHNLYCCSAEYTRSVHASNQPIWSINVRCATVGDTITGPHFLQKHLIYHRCSSLLIFNNNSEVTEPDQSVPILC